MGRWQEGGKGGDSPGEGFQNLTYYQNHTKCFEKTQTPKSWSMYFGGHGVNLGVLVTLCKSNTWTSQWLVQTFVLTFHQVCGLLQLCWACLDLT
jgi:hypothetical protein